jgi:hypothetical protein
MIDYLAIDLLIPQINKEQKFYTPLKRYNKIWRFEHFRRLLILWYIT